jgi:hypothetical protein
MIDKSIRQHYQEGEKVNYITEGIKKLNLLPGEGQTTKDFLADKATGLVTRKVASKLAGTGILSSLGPIGMLIAFMLAKKGINYAKGKIKAPKDIQQALTQGFTGLGVGSPQEQKELRKLEKSRAWMLNRKEEGKGYSEKNLDIVTRAIAEAKGLDINNPNEMRNIDKPITQIRTEKSITEPPSIIPEEPEVKSPFATVIPKTPDVIIPHDTDPIITKPYVPPILKERHPDIIEPAITKPYVPPILEERHPDIPKPKPVVVYTPPVRHHTGGNGGGNGGGGKGSSPSDAPGSPFLKGGRVDKPLMGRNRYI